MMTIQPTWARGFVRSACSPLPCEPHSCPACSIPLDRNGYRLQDTALRASLCLPPILCCSCHQRRYTSLCGPTFPTQSQQRSAPRNQSFELGCIKLRNVGIRNSGRWVRHFARRAVPGGVNRAFAHFRILEARGRACRASNTRSTW